MMHYIPRHFLLMLDSILEVLSSRLMCIYTTEPNLGTLMMWNLPVDTWTLW